MTHALENKAPGRPSGPQDQEKERLQEKIAELESKLFVAEKTVEVRNMLHAYEMHKAGEKKNAESQEKKQRQRKRP